MQRRPSYSNHRSKRTKRKLSDFLRQKYFTSQLTALINLQTL
jgi:hypothetical protein